MNPHLNLIQQPGVAQELSLSMAPQLLQWLRILQLPAQELRAMVHQELETNPALEIDHDAGNETPAEAEWEDAVPDVEPATDPALDRIDLEDKMRVLTEIDDDWREDQRSTDRDHSAMEDLKEWHEYVMDSIHSGASLREHLMQQVGCDGFASHDRAIAELIVGSLDSRGYLTVSVDELSVMGGTSVEHAEEVLGRVQRLDPYGVAARDLQECLLLQMQDLNGEHEIAKRIAHDYLVPASQGNVSLIARELCVDEEEVTAAIEFLATLNPAPGEEFNSEHAEYVTPDVIVSRRNGGYEIELADDHIPRLGISPGCRQLLRQKAVAGVDLSYLRRKIRQAAFLIQGIGERQETLRKVAEQVVRVQREFFDSPEGRLHPLTMVKVGRLLGVHETTVGRAVAHKYVRTPRGVFAMKHFFRKGYRCRDGSGLTPELLKEVLVGMFETEDSAAPLTDLQIVDRLQQERGLRIARRTITKYRKELNVASSKERRRS